jgi:hypothetical protein
MRQSVYRVARWHCQPEAYGLLAQSLVPALASTQGRQAAARALLAPIYGWFTAGFGTVYLQEARALLNALGE